MKKSVVNAERKIYMKLIGSGIKHADPASVESDSAVKPPRPNSRADTATPNIPTSSDPRDRDLERAGREAVAAEGGVQYEKRYRRRRKDGTSPPPRGDSRRPPSRPRSPFYEDDLDA